MLNLDAAGGMSNSGSMEDIARGLVASKTAGEAWTGASAVMPDVSVLQEFIDPDEEQDEEAEKNSVGGSDTPSLGLVQMHQSRAHDLCRSAQAVLQLIPERSSVLHTH